MKRIAKMLITEPTTYIFVWLFVIDNIYMKLSGLAIAILYLSFCVSRRCDGCKNAPPFFISRSNCTCAAARN